MHDGGDIPALSQEARAKPVRNRDNRASVTFPVFTGDGVRSKVLFLGYWKLKNNLANALLVLTLRDRSGQVLETKELLVDSTKAFEIDVQAAFPDSVRAPDRHGFHHSIEAEVYFSRPPVFTYPAMALAIESPGGTSAVHSCCRSYNPNEQLPESLARLPQVGFEIWIGQASNYLAFIGGPRQKSYVLEIELKGQEGSILRSRLNLRQQQPCTLFEVRLEDLFPGALAPGRRYCISVKHDFEDVFPRFYCGNYLEGEGPTLTHSFFDTSGSAGSGASGAADIRIENPDPGRLCDSAFCAPVFPIEAYTTELVSYGCNAGFEGQVDMRLYSLDGTLVASSTRNTAPGGFLQGYARTDVARLFEGTVISPAEYHVVKFQFSSRAAETPTRLKFGLDIARAGAASRGTNICFAPNPIYRAALDKRVSRRWAPVGGRDNVVVFFHNTSFARGPSESRNQVCVSLFNSAGKRLDRSYSMRADESLVVDAGQDPELREFLGGRYGWAYVATDTFASDAWYVAAGKSMVGGDHAF